MGAGVTSRAVAQIPRATPGRRWFGDPSDQKEGTSDRLRLQAWEETEAEGWSNPQDHTGGFRVKPGVEALPLGSQSTTSQRDTPFAFLGSFIQQALSLLLWATEMHRTQFLTQEGWG